MAAPAHVASLTDLKARLPHPVDDVEMHPLAIPFADLPVRPATAVGRLLAVPARSPAAAALREALTVPQPFIPGPGRRQPPPLRFYTHTPGGLLLASRMAWLPLGWRPAIDKRDKGEALPAATAYTSPYGGLFPFQATAVAALAARCRGVGGGMLVAPCGLGKSHMIAALIAALGRRVVVFVPKCFQAAQLADTFRETMPQLRVEVLDGSRRRGSKSGTAAPPPPHVLVVVLQSGARAARSTFDGVGVVVVDEAHHAPAATMQAALANCRAAIVAGFTATPRRSDGCHVVLPHIFGPTVLTVHRPWMPVVVRRLVFGNALSGPRRLRDRHAVLSALGECAVWSATILRAAAALAHRAKAAGGRILVMVDRRRLTLGLADWASSGAAVSAAQWARLATEEARRPPRAPRLVEPALPPPAAAGALFQGLRSEIFVGLQTGKELATAKAADADIYWSTTGMAYEGLDLTHVYAELLACKPNWPQQHAGRVLRVTTMAKVPEIVITAEMAVPQLQRNRTAQLRYFDNTEGWEVVDVPVAAVGAVLARAGTPPKGPTHAYLAARTARHRGTKRPRPLPLPHASGVMQ